MAWNNNYNSYRGGNGGRSNWGNNNYGGGGYNRSGYNQGGYNQGGYNGGGNRQQSRPRKKSGAKFAVNPNTQNPYITAWNKSKSNGFVTFICGPYKDTKEHKSDSGRIWHNWMCKVRQGYNENLYPCLYDPASNRVIVKQLGIVINPKARNGGYCGTFINKG